MGTMNINTLFVRHIGLCALMSAAWAILLSGCVHEPTEAPLTPEQMAVRAERSARVHTELAAEYFYRRQYK